MVIPRNRYVQAIAPFLGKPVIKVLSGIRRCGKSTLLGLIRAELLRRRVAPGNILLINMESLEFEHLTDHRKLFRFVTDSLARRRGRKFVFIDEVQEIPGWEKAVASFLADGVADIVITGSNAHLLGSDLATLLSGRYVEIPVYPLGFAEFLDFRGRRKRPPDLAQEFALFLRYGGFPGIHAFPLSDEVVFQYLSGVFNTILLKDVVRRFAIRDASLLEAVSRFIFDNIGNITSIKRIGDFFRAQKRSVSLETIQNYLLFLERAVLIRKASRFDLKGLRLLEFHEKYFVSDVGLRHGFLGFRDGDVNGLLENVVFLELLRRGFSVHVGKLDRLEIDFIAEKGGERSYVQVCYLLASQATTDREFGALEKVPDHFPKVVLSMDTTPQPSRKGILWKNLIDFLLEPEG